MATDPRWVKIADNNIKEILIDHAFCEQKAASYAISLIVQFPEYDDIVEAMTKLSLEEMSHFGMVMDKLRERGWSLSQDRKDPYVNDLKAFCPKGFNRKTGLIYKLLTAAMIEARSCERFKILSEQLSDPGLKKFYRDLMISEANHYTLFLGFAKTYGKELMDVDKVWSDFLKFEADIMQKYSQTELIHG